LVVDDWGIDKGLLWVYTHNREENKGRNYRINKNKTMPRFDGTGPWGAGAGTGWGMGPCGAGMGWRRGFGYGFGRRFYTKREESDILKEEAEALEEELKAVKERMGEIKGQK